MSFYNNPKDVLKEVIEKINSDIVTLNKGAAVACDDPMGQPFPVFFKNDPTINKIITNMEKINQGLSDLQKRLPDNISIERMWF